MTKFLKVEEVAEMLGLSVQSIYRYTSLRLIPHIKLGRRVVFEPDVIEKWVQEKAIKPGQLN